MIKSRYVYVYAVDILQILMEKTQILRPVLKRHADCQFFYLCRTPKLEFYLWGNVDGYFHIKNCTKTGHSKKNKYSFFEFCFFFILFNRQYVLLGAKTT
jgi:hypothetical protein